MLSKTDAFHYSLLMGLNAADYMGASFWTIPAGVEANPLALTKWFWILKLIIIPVIWLVLLKRLAALTNAKSLLFTIAYALMILGAVSNFQILHGSLTISIVAIGTMMIFVLMLLRKDYRRVRHYA